MDAKTMQAWLPLLVVAIVFAVRFRSLSKPRPLRLGLMWIMPAMLLAIFVLVMAVMPPSPLGWLAVLAGIAVGAAAGWKRGHLMHLDRDPVGGGILMRQSPAAMIFIVGILVARRLLTYEFGPAPGAAHAGQLTPVALMLTDGLLGFATAMVVAMRWTLWQRAKAVPPHVPAGE